MDETLTRTFQANLADGDGRTLDGRLVPYNTVALVSDPPNPTEYHEMFLPGAFERQLAAAGRNKVLLNFEHEQGIAGTLGHAVELHDEPDGLHGSFKVRADSNGDYALELVKEGFLTGLSIEFRSRFRLVNGVKQRYLAHVHKVALCRFPAYENAGVYAVRSRTVQPLPAFDQKLVERLERLKFTVPETLKA